MLPCLVVESRNVTQAMFVTEDMAMGTLFDEAVRRTWSAGEDPPYALEDEQKEDGGVALPIGRNSVHQHPFRQ